MKESMLSGRKPASILTRWRCIGTGHGVRCQRFAWAMNCSASRRRVC